MTIIRTVTGDISPDELGVTFTHEHMLYAHPGCEYDHRNTYDVEEASDDIAAQLRAGRDAHDVATVVDMTTAELGRNPFLIKRSSEKSGVRLVATTGFFPERIGIPFHWTRQTIDYIAEYYVRDITEGMAYASAPTGIKCGLIKVSTGSMGAGDGTSLVAASGRRITDIEERCARAAGRAQARLGCPINTHTEPNDYSVTNPGLELLDILEEEGADPAKVIIGHAFTNPHMDQLTAICDRGASLQLDHIGIPWRHDSAEEFDELMAKTAAELAEAGYIDHLVFSYDRFFRHARGPVSVLEPEMLNEHVDFNYLYDSFVPRLERLGFGTAELRKVLVDNPRRLLAFPDPARKG